MTEDICEMIKTMDIENLQKLQIAIDEELEEREEKLWNRLVNFTEEEYEQWINEGAE